MVKQENRKIWVASDGKEFLPHEKREAELHEARMHISKSKRELLDRLVRLLKVDSPLGLSEPEARTISTIALIFDINPPYTMFNNTMSNSEDFHMSHDRSVEILRRAINKMIELVLTDPSAMITFLKEFVEKCEGHDLWEV